MDEIIKKHIHGLRAEVRALYNDGDLTQEQAIELHAKLEFIMHDMLMADIKYDKKKKLAEA